MCEGNESGVLKTKHSARVSLFCASKRRHTRASEHSRASRARALVAQTPPPPALNHVFFLSIDSTIVTRLHTARDQHHAPTAHHAPAYPAISKTATNNNRQFFGCQRGGGSRIKKISPPPPLSARPPRQTCTPTHADARIDTNTRRTRATDTRTYSRALHQHDALVAERRRCRVPLKRPPSPPKTTTTHTQKKPSPNRHMRKSRPPSRRAPVAYSKRAHPCAPSGVDRTRGRAVFVERRRNTERANREFRQLARPARSVSSGSHCMYEIAISHKIEYFFPRHRSAARLVVWLIFTIGRRGPPTAGYSHRFFLRRSR